MSAATKMRTRGSSSPSTSRSDVREILVVLTRRRPTHTARREFSARSDVLDVIRAAFHHLRKSGFVTTGDGRAQALHRGPQSNQRRLSVLIEILDLEIEMRILARHSTRDIELSIEGRARELLQSICLFAALRERRQKCDVQRV